MDFQQFLPSELLKPYVRHYYLFQSDADTEFSDTVFPSGDMEMIFNLGGGTWEAAEGDSYYRTPPVELWGQITRPLPIKSKGKHTMLGVKFFTHSAACFLNEEMTIFNDHVYDLYEIMGKPIKTLHQQLLETKETAARIKLIENFLLKMLARNERKIFKIDKVGDMLSTIKTSTAENSLSLVASQHNVTPRYLHKLVNQYTGLSPTAYHKINRFQHSLKLISKGSQSLTAIAYSSGYFDQSHFIRDFKSFTGITPSAYLDNVTPVNQLLMQ
ncbi:helix-turn-helix transcriptional regulator [Mucilaginibacter celer]|uniref:Helix-turn-helix domain-containing protein n=1 Tax=Mucilaginibacter celer TaxID=2305508 RepID=A0A494VRA2_9SPHI|nr:helix-turn-helix transcriptional regulator [Mucilaginibacter celer]AYL98126.1 helix-turn-helix domain-containing protein [Mucilaginibacter celer]